MTLGSKNINWVTENDLCTQCGTCYGVCPRNNIEANQSPWGEYVFKVKAPDQCRNCNICIRVCPGHSVDFDSLNQRIFSQHPSGAPLGSFQSSWLSSSNNGDIVRKSASGGMVTTLLTHALKSGMIEGALVVRNRSGRPFEVELFLAQSEEEIIGAAQSKYRPIPMNMGLKQIMQSKGKFAVVGLPCHIHGIRKTENLLPRLKRRIAFRLGLFCINTARFAMTRYLLKRRRIPESAVLELSYRDKSGRDKLGRNRSGIDNSGPPGWPGGMKIVNQQGNPVFIPYKEYQYAQSLFTPQRCEFCPDFANELADIALGDAHLEEFKEGRPYKSQGGHFLEGRKGWNFVLVRTPDGNELWQRASKGNLFTSHEIDPEEIVNAQKSGLYHKKHSYFARTRLHKVLGKKLPHYSGLPKSAKLHPSDFIKPVLSIFLHALLATSHGPNLLSMIPEKYLKKKLSLKQKLISKTISV